MPAQSPAPWSDRVVEPEWLDGLAPNDPGALANRRDLRKLNFLMGSFRWWRRSLRADLPAGARVLELGAGDGELARFVRRAPAPVWHWSGLDRVPRPATAVAFDAWITADLLTFNDFGDFDAVVVNLLLHQFEAPALRELGRRLNANPRPRRLWIVEPLRARHGLWLFALAATLLRFHPVSRHDGPVSLRAGFRPGELPALLDPKGNWQWRETADPRATLRVTALR